MSAITAPIQSWLNTGLGFLYPEICRICEADRATAKSGFVCSKCWLQVRFIRPPFCERCGLPFEGDITTAFECSNCREMELYFSSARSAVVAKTIVLEIIHRFKYLPVLREQSWDFIAPVPLHSVKEREREFNQAELLARHLSDAAKIPLNNHLLRRVSPTATQTLLTRDQRAENMRGAFAVRDGVKLDGGKIILVDDVFTTGATTSACAKALKAAGAGDVCVWTIARGL